MDYIALLIQENMKLEADSINRYKDLLSVIGDNFPTIRNIVEEISQSG